MNEENKVVVTFTGICTHCANVPLPPLQPKETASDAEPEMRGWRTVLVNASHGLRLGEEGVPPHAAQLQICRKYIAGEVPSDIPGLTPISHGEVLTWSMNGVRLYIENGEGPVTCTKEFSEDVPSLTRCAEVLSLQLDERVVLEGRAAAVFDVYHGELDAYRTEPRPTAAVRGRLTVCTAGAPQLVITEIWSNATTKLTLQNGWTAEQSCVPHVSLMNTGVREDKELDFLLHYHVTTWSPPPGKKPHPDEAHVTNVPVVTDPCAEPSFGGLSVGCSNTTYP